MIRWSRLAITELENIIEYLQREWTDTEVRNFKERLKKVLTYISEFPELYPLSENLRLRKCVLTEQVNLYYKIVDDIIFIVNLYDNRQNPENLKS